MILNSHVVKIFVEISERPLYIVQRVSLALALSHIVQVVPQRDVLLLRFNFLLLFVTAVSAPIFLILIIIVTGPALLAVTKQETLVNRHVVTALTLLLEVRCVRLLIAVFEQSLANNITVECFQIKSELLNLFLLENIKFVLSRFFR